MGIGIGMGIGVGIGVGVGVGVGIGIGIGTYVSVRKSSIRDDSSISRHLYVKNIRFEKRAYVFLMKNFRRLSFA